MVKAKLGSPNLSISPDGNRLGTLVLGRGGPSRCGGKDDGEQATPAQPRLGIQGTTVGLGDVLRDGQSQAEAASLDGTGPGPVGPPEAVENVRQVSGRDADPGVANGDRNLPRSGE